MVIGDRLRYITTIDHYIGVEEITRMTMVKNGARRGRPLSFDRAAALEQAMRAFWAAGFDGTSIPMLTDAMGISAQSLYAAFGSKEALYREAIDLYRETIGGFAVRVLASEADALQAVAQVLHQAAAAFSRPEEVLGCMITTAPAGMGDEPLVRLGRELRAAGVRHVAERLARGVREDQVRSDADCNAWARYVGSVVQGLSVQARDGVPVDALTTVATIAASALDGLRRGDAKQKHESIR